MGWIAYETPPLVRVDSMYTLFLQRHKKGHNFRGESHNFWECVYVMNGNVCVTADERVMSLSAGDIVFHKPFELHKFLIESDTADLFIFSFSMSGTLEKAMRDKVAHLDGRSKDIITDMLKYSLDLGADTDIEHINNSYIACHANFAENPDFLQSISLYVSLLVLSLAKTESRYTATVSPSAGLFTKAARYLSANVDKNVSIPELAAHINVSESSLKRIFRKYANMGVHRYFLLLKIQAATALLQDGLSVSEVAERLGFCDQGYFSVCYKRETGQNPSYV